MARKKNNTIRNLQRLAREQERLFNNEQAAARQREIELAAIKKELDAAENRYRIIIVQACEWGYRAGLILDKAQKIEADISSAIDAGIPKLLVAGIQNRETEIAQKVIAIKEGEAVVANAIRSGNIEETRRLLTKSDVLINGIIASAEQARERLADLANLQEEALAKDRREFAQKVGRTLRNKLGPKLGDRVFRSAGPGQALASVKWLE